jgi:hypothetical protein
MNPMPDGPSGPTLPLPNRRKLDGSGLRLGGVPGLPDLEDFPTELATRPEDAFPNRKEEARRVLKRLETIVTEHVRAAERMGVTRDRLSFKTVVDWLRDHAKGGTPELPSSGDPVLDYLHQGLIDDLLLEPGNVLLATPTGPDSIRYDAMDAAFWRECLDLLETSLSEST